MSLVGTKQASLSFMSHSTKVSATNNSCWTF